MSENADDDTVIEMELKDGPPGRLEILKERYGELFESISVEEFEGTSPIQKWYGRVFLFELMHGRSPTQTEAENMLSKIIEEQT